MFYKLIAISLQINRYYFIVITSIIKFFDFNISFCFVNKNFLFVFRNNSILFDRQIAIFTNLIFRLLFDRQIVVFTNSIFRSLIASRSTNCRFHELYEYFAFHVNHFSRLQKVFFSNLLYSLLKIFFSLFNKSNF